MLLALLCLASTAMAFLAPTAPASTPVKNAGPARPKAARIVSVHQESHFPPTSVSRPAFSLEHHPLPLRRQYINDEAPCDRSGAVCRHTPEPWPMLFHNRLPAWRRRSLRMRTSHPT